MLHKKNNREILTLKSVIRDIKIAEPLLMTEEGQPETDKVRHSAFADDLAGGGTIDQLRHWWDLIIEGVIKGMQNL